MADPTAKPRPRSKLARANIFPCGFCEQNVSWSKTAIACDACDIWFHRSCHSLSVSKFEHLSEHTWRCYRCQTFLNSSFTYHSYELTPDHELSKCHSSDDRNLQDDTRSSKSTDSNPHYSPRRSFCPSSHSTPDSQNKHKPYDSPSKSSPSISHTHRPSPSSIAANHSVIQTSALSNDHLSTLSSYHSDISSLFKIKDSNNWRTIVLNANGLNMVEKKANLENLIEYVGLQLDAIIISET